MKKTVDAKIEAVRKMQKAMYEDVKLAETAGDGHTKLSGSLLAEIQGIDTEKGADDDVNFGAEVAGVAGVKGSKPKKDNYTRINDRKQGFNGSKGFKNGKGY